MMGRIISILVAAVLLAACVEEPFEPLDGFEGGDGMVTLNFGHYDFDPVKIETRAALPTLIESRVTNIYVMIFNPAGEKIYGHFFNSENRKLDDAELRDTEEDCWWVENLDPQKGDDDKFTAGAMGGYTHGKLRMKAPEVSGGRIYLFANLDPDIINLSDGKLSLIAEESELQNMVVKFNQQSTSRSGLFLMTGYTDVTITNGGNDYTFGKNDNSSSRYDGTYQDSQDPLRGRAILLDRIDAKVTVRVGIIPGAITEKPAARADGTLIYETDENGDYKLDGSGNRIPVISRQTIESFSPVSWQVINLSNGSYLLPRSDSDAPASETGGFWNSEINAFEMVGKNVECQGFDDNGDPIMTNRTEETFEFYMLENRQSSSRRGDVNSAAAQTKYPGIKAYHLRDKRLKEDGPMGTGSYTVDAEGNIWEFAPKNGTYLVIKGEVKMRVKDSDSYAAQTMNALTTYYIHLGNFGKHDSYTGLNDYDVRRNTHYTYTINIKGVRNIEIEVEEDNDEDDGWRLTNENQSGAEGNVYIAQESIHTFDAHYGQRVFRFNADAIRRTAESDMLTWYVDTPFGRDGTPERVGPDMVEVPTNLDYEWVHFRLNDRNGTINVAQQSGTVNQLNGKFFAFSGYNEASSPAGYYPYSQNQYFQYDQRNQPYTVDDGTETPENRLMNVMELCDFLRKQIELYIEDQKHIPDKRTGKYEEGYVKKSLFDEPLKNDEGEIIWKTITVDGETLTVPEYGGGNLYISAYVDEFYYETHPITGNYSESLWRSFVYTPENQMRLMHILCDSKISADDMSTATGSVVTIRQRPIQTIYEVSSERVVDEGGEPINEAWGTETIDETRQYAKQLDKDIYFYNINRTLDKKDNAYGTAAQRDFAFNTAETTQDNGRYNTYRLWNLNETQRWDTYLDYKRMNDHVYNVDGSNVTTIFLKDDPKIATLRYTCLQRNRDNNGNGIIDDDEVRWYLACTDQLLQMYVGDLGLTGEGQLYNTYDMSNESTFRSHVLSSSVGGKQEVWAEEGCSTGSYNVEYGKYARFSVRCVRNLGLKTNSYVLSDKDDKPLNPVRVTEPSGTVTENSVYSFDLSNINYLAKRNYPVSNDLVPMSEHSQTAMPFHHFETGPAVSSGGMKYNNYVSVYNQLNDGIPYCPKGYRLPNIREMAVIMLNVPGGDWWAKAPFFVSNYYSFGYYGDRQDGNSYSWSVSSGQITVGNAGGLSINFRCVRDVDLSENQGGVTF